MAEAAELLSLSYGQVKRLVASGELHSVKSGRLRRIPARAIDDYVAALEADAALA
jgi:excisionase family DNA binding protein